MTDTDRDRDREMFYKMLKMQKEYDLKVLSDHNLPGYEAISDRIQCAMLDEIGELNHELKGNWCWWKHTQKDPDPEKVKEEFADVVHFALCWINATPSKHTEAYINSRLETGPGGYSYTNGMRDMVGSLLCSEPIRILRAGKEMLGLTWEEVYQLYCQKHKTNLERLANSY